MKKCVGLFLCLAVLLCTACGVLAAKIGESREQVTLEHTAIFGDAAVLSGAAVDFNVMFGNHLLWENRWSPELGDAAEAEFTYSFFERKTESSERNYGLWLNVPKGGNLGNSDATRENALDRAYREAYESVKPGERKEFTFRIADYLDYYPLEGRITLPGLNLHFGPYMDAAELAFITKMEEFLRIPVLPDEELVVDIDRSSDGATTGIGIGNKDETDAYYMVTSGFATDAACYFTFDTKTTKGEVVDTSHIPGGYGIYRLPYTVTDEKTQVDAGDCELFFPMDPADSVYEMFYIGDRIYLVLYEGEQVVLRVLQLSTGRELERLPIATGVRIYDLQRFADFFVLKTSDDRLTVVTLGETAAVELSVLSEHTELAGSNYGARETMAWDGERLLIANTLAVQENWVEGTGFRLVVYDATGLRYAGIYQSSLLARGEWSDNCRPDEYGTALAVRWR